MLDGRSVCRSPELWTAITRIASSGRFCRGSIAPSSMGYNFAQQILGVVTWVVKGNGYAPILFCFRRGTLA